MGSNVRNIFYFTLHFGGGGDCMDNRVCLNTDAQF